MNLFRMFLVGVGCVLCITIVLYLFFLPLAQPNQAKPLFRSLIEVRLEDQIPEDQLLGIVKSAAELRKRTEGYRRHAFNVLISDRIGWHRSLPDVRPDRCRNQTYVFKPSESLSIIICFHNEALSTLLRTVQSVLMRSDHALVHEILVINDFSTDHEEMQRIQDALIRLNNDKLRLMHLPERSGLIRARLYGAKQATGNVLMFLDSHVEVNDGWVEPLLHELHRDNRTIAIPTIDVINADNFVYTASPMVRGGFNWGLHFRWDSFPVNRSFDQSLPIRTPTMAGGLFAVYREYFFAIGAYDEGMEIWGGENLELSFRVWMCGGSLKQVPCSRIGHVFRSRRPYDEQSTYDSFTRNSLRVAHVWLDEYKKYFFEVVPKAQRVHYGDISSRLQLRHRLACRSFDWYLKNVYPEMRPPSPLKNTEWTLAKKTYKLMQLKPKLRPAALVRGQDEVVNRFQLQLSGSNWCAESEHEVTRRKGALVLNKCNAIKRQMWSETHSKQLLLAGLLCLDGNTNAPYLEKCHQLGGTQEWRHSSQRNAMIYNMAVGLCLGVKRIRRGEQVIMTICGSDESIKWNLMIRLD